MACCPNGNECNHIITLGYLREFIGDNIKDSNGNVKHVTTTKGDEYCPTYSDLTGGTLIPNFVDAGSGRWSLNVDGITVNGSYSNNQCVMQKDLVLTYTEFESLSITATPSTNIDSCSGTSTLSYTYKLRKTVKSMDGSCSVGESSTTNNDTTNVITYSSNQSWATISKPTVTMSKNNPNNNGRSNNRTVTITGKITYKGATKSATATITQNGLTGSYKFWYSDYYVHDRGVSCVGSTFGCEGGNYGATAYYYQDDWKVYRWQDKCGTNYDSDTQERDRVNNTYHEYDSYSNSFPNNTETGGPARTDSKSWPGYGSCSWSQSYCPPPDCPTCETNPEICNKTVYGYGTYTGTVPCTGGTVYMNSILIPGTSYTYSYDEEASACTVTTAATSTRQSRNIYIDCNTGNAKTHTGTIGNINYTITQPAGPCCTPATSITYTDIVIPCDAADGVVGESIKTVRTTGSCCNQSSSTSRVSVVIGDVECNSGDTREITGIPHEGDFKIYQEGRANCCCTCDTAEFNVAGASISRNIPANGYSTPVVIGTYNASTCLTGITATTSVNWITIASVSNGNVNATISQNTSLTDDRNGRILVSGRDKDGKPCGDDFPVIQSKSASTCTCESVDIGAASAGVIPAVGYSVATLIGTYDGATCLTDITATTSDNWITITSVGNGSINGTVSQNTSLSDDKSGTITVYSKDAYGNTCPYDFVVIQSKSASTCTCANVNINAASASVIPAAGYSVPTLIGTYDSSICLTDITAMTSDNWITITSVGNGSINATVLQNESVDNDKVGVITVSSKDAYGTTCQETFPVTQIKNTCQDPTTVYMYEPIELPCDAAASFMTAITYSAVTSYSNCEPTIEVGTNTVTVPSVICNDGGINTIQEGRTGITLADAAPQITQVGGCVCCTCDDLSIDRTSESWDYDVTTTKYIAVMSASCVTNISLSTLEHFNATIGNEHIAVSPKGENIDISDYIETLTVSYNGDCSSAITLTQQCKPCTCDDLTIAETSMTFNWNSSIPKLVDITSGKCVTNIQVTCEGENFHSLTVGGKIYVETRENNTGDTVLTGTLTITYNDDCSKTVELMQAPSRQCSDFSFSTIDPLSENAKIPTEAEVTLDLLIITGPSYADVHNLGISTTGNIIFKEREPYGLAGEKFAFRILSCDEASHDTISITNNGTVCKTYDIFRICPCGTDECLCDFGDYKITNVVKADSWVTGPNGETAFTCDDESSIYYGRTFEYRYANNDSICCDYENVSVELDDGSRVALGISDYINDGNGNVYHAGGWSATVCNGNVKIGYHYDYQMITYTLTNNYARTRKDYEVKFHTKENTKLWSNSPVYSEFWPNAKVCQSFTIRIHQAPSGGEYSRSGCGKTDYDVQMRKLVALSCVAWPGEGDKQAEIEGNNYQCLPPPFEPNI